MLREGGDPRAIQEQHQHGADCGHQDGSPVQRSAVHDVLSTSGQALDGATRSDMEARLGADFSDVRIHNDSSAKASAAEVGARAYTSGNHVVIGGNGNDKHTLAHELTHVVQQRQGPVAGTDNGGGLRISDPGDRFEREAEANATRVMSRQAPEPAAARAPSAAQTPAEAPAGDPSVQRIAVTPQGDALSAAVLSEVGEGSVVTTAASGQTVYRVTNGTTARSYLLKGIGKVTNSATWTELGEGLYTGHDFGHAEAYADSMTGLPVILELTLKENARGIRVANTTNTDGKKLPVSSQAFDYLTDPHDAQFKFHQRYYTRNLTITRLHSRDQGGGWAPYEPDAFVPAFDAYLAASHRRKAEALPRGNGAPEHQQAEPPAGAKDAAEEDMQLIRFSEHAAAYEQRLATYLMGRQDVRAEVDRLVKLAWSRITETKKRGKFGTQASGVTGMVGNDEHMVQRVVESGSLREQMAFLCNGYTQGLFAEVARVRQLPRPDAIEYDRESRLDVEKQRVEEINKIAVYTEEGRKHQKRVVAKELATDAHALDVNPELSQGEWYSAVGPDGKLGWRPGAKSYDYQMKSPTQQEALHVGGLVKTGISGTAFGILQSAEVMDKHWDAKANPFLLRLALLAWMISADDHTYAEIMHGASVFNPELTYHRGYRTYRYLHPIDEQTLRANVAPDGMFPDELVPALSERELGLLNTSGYTTS